MTWLPEAELRALGIEIFKRDQLFVMANGQYVTRHVGTAVIEHGEFKTVDEVVFAQPGDLSLLGVRTIEGFNALVDSKKKKLVAAGCRYKVKGKGRVVSTSPAAGTKTNATVKVRAKRSKKARKRR